MNKKSTYKTIEHKSKSWTVSTTNNYILYVYTKNNILLLQGQGGVKFIYLNNKISK